MQFIPIATRLGVLSIALTTSSKISPDEICESFRQEKVTQNGIAQPISVKISVIARASTNLGIVSIAIRSGLL